MKQYIDSKQLKELTPNQFRQLCKLVGDKYHFMDADEKILNCFQEEYLTMYISILEKTNIGKMIEILDNNDITLSLYRRHGKYHAEFYDEMYNNRPYRIWRQEGMDSYCDILWNEVKKLL